MIPSFLRHRVSRSVALATGRGCAPVRAGRGSRDWAFLLRRNWARGAPRDSRSCLDAHGCVDRHRVGQRELLRGAARSSRPRRPKASGVGGPTDEFDRIEQAVGTWDRRSRRRRQSGRAPMPWRSARLREQATMLAGAVSDSLSQLDEVRLPLQILLESPFGELNDNQEELLRDARAAADAIDAALRRLGQVADIDREASRSSMSLFRSTTSSVRFPLARAAAERRGARTETALEPGLPRVMADRARLAEALSLFVTDAASCSSSSQPLSISTARDGARALIRVAPANESRSASLILASRLIEVQGGEVRLSEGVVDLRIGQ